MIRHVSQWKWVLVAVGVSACAATPLSTSGGINNEEATGTDSFEELCEEASSTVALCAGEQCGLYRCREVKEHLAVGRVVLDVEAVRRLGYEQDLAFRELPLR